MVTARTGQLCADAVTAACNTISKVSIAPRQNPGIDPSP
jgi:hypothetical protein